MVDDDVADDDDRRLMCVCRLNAGALLDAAATDFTYTAFRYQVEKHNNITSSAFKLDKYEKQLNNIGDNFQLIRAGLYTAQYLHCPVQS